MQCELRAFVLFLELFVLIGNRPIIGRLFGTDYRPTDNRPVRYRCIPTNDTAAAVRYLEVVSTTAYRVVLAVYRTVTLDG